MIGLVLMAAAHVAAASPNRFNLVCEGHRMEATSAGEPGRYTPPVIVEGEAYTATYAIDLDAGLSWLVGSQENPFRLTVVPGRFVITEQPIEIIERTDGSWLKTEPYVKGVCRKAPYTPMPAPAF